MTKKKERVAKQDNDERGIVDILITLVMLIALIVFLPILIPLLLILGLMGAKIGE